MSDYSTAWMQTVRRLRQQSAIPADYRTAFDAEVSAHRIAENAPKPMWFPEATDEHSSNLAGLLSELDHPSYQAFYDWSIRETNEFWSKMINATGIVFQQPPSEAIQSGGDVTDPKWLPRAEYNIVDSCFRHHGDSTAIVTTDEHRGLRKISRSELKTQVNQVVASLRAADFQPGDAIAIVMPMNVESVVAYLGIIAAGCTAVSVADSFASPEIAKRLRISGAKAVFCSGQIQRASKTIDIYSRVIEADAPRTIVIGQNANQLRDSDQSWLSFLSVSANEPCKNAAYHMADANHVTGILFSSGTTGTPKAIVWDQTTPVKCAVDGYLLQDICEGDVVVWPTNLGWMMGPWLIYASLINGATIGLFPDAPVGTAFGRFVQDAGVTMLGVVPTLVRAWRASQAMESFDWGQIRCFSSTGEASSADDMFYLSSLAGMRPVIEYCGGTEIGGGYISSTVLQPNIPAAFSTAVPGNQLFILDDEDQLSDEGTVFLAPPWMGMSRRLLNRDHRETYYADCPVGPNQETLRRHGDHFRRLPRGYFVAGGRVDDTMNLGGIKISSAEIEAVLNSDRDVRETAAIGVPSEGGGPEELVVFAVTTGSVDEDELHSRMNMSVRSQLNPLFKIRHMKIVDSLPRTASNKVMRRRLRDAFRSEARE